ncbi:MAG: hypothetical protein U0W24_10740 [Bacteroidales bacterium]
MSIIIDIIILAVLISVIILLVWYSHYLQTRKKKKKIEHFLKFVNKNNYNINECEVLHDNLIGIDTSAKMLFFQNLKKKFEFVVDLSIYNRCHLNETSRSINGQNSKSRITDKLELAFSPVNPKQPVLYLEFYNVENGDFQVSGEFDLLEKWIQIINKQFK